MSYKLKYKNNNGQIREVLLQELAGQWYAICIDNKSEDPTFTKLPEGVHPSDESFNLFSFLGK